MANGNLHSLLQLLEEKGTLTEVSNFLKRRGLTHSASSWDQMRSERILPALQQGDITEQHLLSLLGELEEHGHQHIFLYEYRDDEVDSVFSEDEEETINLIPADEDIQANLEEIEATDVYESPRFFERPDEPSLSEVRTEEGTGGQALVIKAVETRIYTETLGREEREGDEYAIAYRDVPVRAVNLFRLHSHGLLELRLQQHENASQDYEEERERMWGLVQGFLDRNDFTPLYISRAKYNLWDQRQNLQNIVRYSNSRFRDSHGNSMRAASGGRHHNLAQDQYVVDGLMAFNAGNTTCDTAIIWWLEQSNGPPSKDLRTRLAGEPNEFAITAGFNREDYEYVLRNILRFN